MLRSLLRGAPIALLAALLFSASCRGDDADAQGNGTEDKPAEIYSAILSQLVADAGPPNTTEDDEKPAPLFVESLGDGYVIDLTVQAKVVDYLKDVADVRFIDNRAEAIDADKPGEPVRDGGMLVGLGPLLKAGDGRRTVAVRRYIGPSEDDDSVATITATAQGWSVRLE